MTDGIPPALRDFDLERAVVFLDFDGTLVELAATPDAIVVPDDLRPVLDRLHRATDGRLVIVSGRPVDQIAGFLPDFPGDIHGAHGAERRVAGQFHAHPLAGSDAVAELQSSAQDAIAEHPAILLERKQSGLVLHYRADASLADTARDIAERLVAQAGGDFVLHPSKMAYEVRPSDADKGGALDRVMAGQSSGLLPVVFGDDTTDEEAMLRARAHGGFGVKVGEGDSIAACRLADPAAVLAVLQHWTRDIAP